MTQAAHALKEALLFASTAPVSFTHHRRRRVGGGGGGLQRQRACCRVMRQNLCFGTGKASEAAASAECGGGGMQRKCACCMLSLVSALGVEISECSGGGGGLQRLVTSS